MASVNYAIKENRKPFDKERTSENYKCSGSMPSGPEALSSLRDLSAHWISSSENSNLSPRGEHRSCWNSKCSVLTTRQCSVLTLIK